MKNLYPVFLFLLLLSCATSKRFNPNKKYAPQQLQEDYTLFRKILEAHHPGLYWYTSKDSMDYYFERGKNALKDSLNEVQFRNVLSYTLSKIRCGHTTARPSKAFARHVDSNRLRLFPLSLKIWSDTALVTVNINRRDTAVGRGVLLTSIDGRPMPRIVDSLFQFLSADGHNLTHKYQTLSNRGTFGNMYLNVFGYKTSFQTNFIDTLGRLRTARINLYRPVRDTGQRTQRPVEPKPSGREKKQQALSAARSLRTDTALRTAFMDLNTFTKDGRLHGFFRQSFKRLRKNKIQNLVIDLRGNGGGNVTNSNLLTKYVAQRPFKIADSLYALKRSSRYGRYLEKRFANWVFLFFITRKGHNGRYHFRYFENRSFRPKKKNHFDGDVYVLTGGNTFSASTLFIQAVSKQSNVTVVGEETGGGAYGNNAWLIPDVTLPRTGVRFRLPLFRLVIDKDAPKGWGIPPEVEALPTVEAIRRNRDFKMQKAIELIKAKSQSEIRNNTSLN